MQKRQLKIKHNVKTKVYVFFQYCVVIYPPMVSLSLPRASKTRQN